MTAPVAALANPYPGLASFEERDSSAFFGRDREIDELLDRLASRRLLAVIGVSGCGKSSLVQAGVIPVLRMGVAENLPRHWRICTITPGNAPLRSLREALDVVPDWPITSFDLVDHARNTLRARESLLLVVDQFEEIFRFRDEALAHDGGNEASLFVNLLLKATEQREIPIYVLLTMRTDFLGKCAQFRGLPEALNDCYYLVPRMTRLQQQEAIERPLQQQGATMHPALVQRLLNDSAEDPDHLPILQHLLKRLWENWIERRTGGSICMDDYKAVGGWANALDADAETVLTELKVEEEGLRRLFQWITERGTGEEPIRRPRSFLECLEVSGLTQEDLGQVVAAFQKRGLLKSSDHSNYSQVNLQHESVMWQWSRLKRWIDEEVEQVARLRFFLQAARQNNPLTGLALSSALQWRWGLRTQRHWVRWLGRYLTAQEIEQTEAWIVCSEQIEQTRRRRRLWIFSSTGTLVVMIIVVWIFGERQRLVEAREQRKLAEARELSGWAALSLSEDPERSLILGLHSWGKQHRMVSGLEEILHVATLQSHSRLTLRGHQAPIVGIAWSPDGKRLATASWDKTAKVWETSTGRELLSLQGHQTEVWGIAWSPDGTRLATGSDDRTVKVWETTSGHELLTLHGHQGAILCVAWSPRGTKIASASNDRTAKVWDARTGQELLTLRPARGRPDEIWSVAWSPDGNKLATGGRDHKVRIWDARTGRELLTLNSHLDVVWTVAWSPDGSKLATASEDRTAKLWEADTGNELLTLRTREAVVRSIAWSPDGSRLATASYDSTANVWETRTGHELLTLRGHKAPVRGIAWSPDGSRLATASEDYTAKVWLLDIGCELHALQGHRAPVRSVAWSPDGSKLATASEDNTAKVWRADTGEELFTLRGHRDVVRSIAWSPDGTKVATASWDQTAKIWDAITGKELLPLRGHQSRVGSIVWSPDGTKLATASWDKTAKVWDAANGNALLTLRSHQGTVWSVSWSPNGNQLATASDDRTVIVWDSATGRELSTLQHQYPVWSVSWSPDGTKLASSEDKLAKVWSMNSGKELLILRGHHADVWNIAWSRDGSKLATASYDHTEKLWESDTGRELLTLHGHQARVGSVSWSPDGRRVASAGHDNIVQIYLIDQVGLLRLVHFRVTRDLTQDECRRYLSTDHCPPLPAVP